MHWSRRTTAFVAALIGSPVLDWLDAHLKSALPVLMFPPRPVAAGLAGVQLTALLCV